MIEIRDVIRMKIPFPWMTSGLALKAHMYICKNVISSDYEFVKCQTLKPSMIGNSNFPAKHYIDERPDITRNPFVNPTRIDCDKVFLSSGANYADSMKTTSRPDVCPELFSEVIHELEIDGYEKNKLDIEQLKLLNHSVS